MSINSEIKETALCSFCSEPLKLLKNAISARCMMCGERGRTRTWCKNGHFVCEECRGGEVMQVVEGLLELERTIDPAENFLMMRNSHDFPMHGPEHHVLVAASFLLTYYDQYQEPSWDVILDTLQSAATQLPGGSCGFWGACSAGLAIGMTYCAILDSDPTNPEPRSIAHQAVSKILARISEFKAARCCRRECLLSIQVGCELSAELLPHSLTTTIKAECEQAQENYECTGNLCPFFDEPVE